MPLILNIVFLIVSIFMIITTHNKCNTHTPMGINNYVPIVYKDLETKKKNAKK